MRLSERRELICLKFAKNSLGLDNDNFKQLFPMFQTDHNMKTRQKEEFQVSMSHDKRYAVSAIPSMQRLLKQRQEKTENIV